MNKFILGAAFGLIAGLLLAPEKGEDLREDIADTAGQWRNKLGKLIGKANGSLDDLRNYLDKNIDGLSDDVKRRILSILDDAQEMAYSSQNDLRN